MSQFEYDSKWYNPWGRLDWYSHTYVVSSQNFLCKFPKKYSREDFVESKTDLDPDSFRTPKPILDAIYIPDSFLVKVFTAHCSYLDIYISKKSGFVMVILKANFRPVL